MIDPPPIKIKINKTKSIRGKLFRLSLVTENFYFYSNYKDGDENSNTLIYSRSTDQLISNNYFAYEALEDVLSSENYMWASSYLKKCYAKYVKYMEKFNPDYFN
jgi:hypothetical protein